jgi:hypothetical protein
LRRQAVLSLFLRILVQEIPYNTNTPQRATLANSLATVAYFSSNEQIQNTHKPSLTTPQEFSRYSFFSLVFFLCFHLSKSQMLWFFLFLFFNFIKKKLGTNILLSTWKKERHPTTPKKTRENKKKKKKKNFLLKFLKK